MFLPTRNCCEPVKTCHQPILVNVGDGKRRMLNALIGWALGFSVLSAGVVWLHFQWQNERHIVLRNHMQQDARALMETMVHDLKRSNFQALLSNNSPGNSGQCPSDFCGLPEDFEISQQHILFSWDRNANGIKNNNECSGFRRNGKDLQTKTSCKPVVWTTMNDSKNLQILELNFRIECDLSPGSLGHVVAVAMRFQSSTEKTPQSVQRLIRLRNHNMHVGSTDIACGANN